MASAATKTANASADILGTGRRKSSIARVRVRQGQGAIRINGRDLDNYFTNDKDRNAVLAPLVESGIRDSVDVVINVHGGGFTGQSGACKLGIARALKTFHPECEEALRDAHLLTRDGRMKERKKAGLHGARKGTQFSKR